MTHHGKHCAKTELQQVHHITYRLKLTESGTKTGWAGMREDFNGKTAVQPPAAKGEIVKIGNSFGLKG
jgi:hypothetical protein